MADIDWKQHLLDADVKNNRRRKAEIAQQWVEQVLSVPQERTLRLGRDAWRYYFHKDGQPLCIPLYEDPIDDTLWAVLPEGLDEVQITYSAKKVLGRGL